MPLKAPAGLFGAGERRIKPIWVVSAVGVVAFLVGIGAGAGGADPQTQAVSTLTAPRVVTSTVQASPVTVTSTPSAATITAVKTVKSVTTVTKTKTSTKTVAAPVPLVGGGGGDSVYYDTCADARAAGDTPLYAGDPGYSSHLDRDGDGVACE